MKESEIRSRATHDRYLELVAADAERLASNTPVFETVPCPACDGRSYHTAFAKSGFTYVECETCETLYVNPRPSFAALVELYEQSPSTKYWVEEFFTPMAEPRRAKIFRPRASYVATRFPELATGRIGDIGAGFGLFLQELRQQWVAADMLAIEPSTDMAAILRGHGIPVLEQMLEHVAQGDAQFDLLTAFELFEHLHRPDEFLARVFDLLRPGGHLYMTTLNGHGFDIQLLWERSKSVSPPHHLNFVNPRSMTRLLERVGFEVVEVSTPGELDWDIIEGGWRAGQGDPGRFFRTVATYGSAETKRALQDWVRDFGFSSHLRAVARKPL